MSAADPRRFLARPDLGALFAALAAAGRTVIGPTRRDGAIVYAPLTSPDDLPTGWTDEQAPGHYRLRPRDDQRAFAYAVGPHSWKARLFPARDPLDTGSRADPQRVSFAPAPPPADHDAFLGVRACELAAMRVQDRVFRHGAHEDPRYAARRDDALIIAVACTEAGDLCFCTSMGTGPAITDGADLVLTELDDGFLVRADTDRGHALLADLPTAPAAPAQRADADAAVAACAASMGRHLDTDGLPDLLLGNLDHPRWADVASRCLSCASCTLVCPTCFCFSVDDASDLAGLDASRSRSWTSCFTISHAQIHGGQFRPSTHDRYRQWLTHKLSTWHGQFGESGCVGCGRCIAWCPVGIDLTEEVAAIRADPAPPVALPPAPTPPPTRARVSPAGDPLDPMTPEPVRLVAVHAETADTVTLHVEAPPGYAHLPGQFNMLSLPGVGEVPISVASVWTPAPPADSADSAAAPLGAGLIEHTIRAVGATTRALCGLRPGDSLGLRGPYGTAWPLDAARGRPVVVIAGGLGLPPVRGALRALLAAPDDYPSVWLMYGARSPADLVYKDELLGWAAQGRLRLGVTVDRADVRWSGNVGVVTSLMRRKPLPPHGLYLVCGPEVMMRFVLRALAAAGVPPAHIYLSMERRMQCAVAHCGQCQYGPHLICRDGPVFRYDQIHHLFGRPGW